MDGKDTAKLIGCVAVCLLAGAVGGIFTYPNIAGWYANLNKPALTPPNWAFGPAWTALYILMGIAAYFVLREGFGKEKVREALGVFAAQLALNVLWSLVFFGLRSPFYGLGAIAGLWLAIAVTIFLFWKISKVGAALLVPYIIWVSFAAYLNYSVYALN